MDDNAAEELPALYRAVLDRIAQLEAAGDRALARSIRRDAIRIYSRAWDDRARRRLVSLLRRSTAEVVGSRAGTAQRGFRRWSVVTD